MDFINTVINLVKDHWVEILAIIGSIDIILGIVVKWTKTDWDDNVYTVIHGWISKIGQKK